jgi:hypothetical protein
MSQPADLKLFTGLEAFTATSAPSEIDLVIDELDRWSTSDMAAASAAKVCWMPLPVTVGELPRLARVA